MISPLEESYTFLINKWGINFKGIGSIMCIPPLDYSRFVVGIISLMRNKNPNIKIIIAVGKWEQRCKIFDLFNELNISLNNISCITYTYINAKYNYEYDLAISVGVNEWNLYLNTIYNRSKFKLMILTDNVIKANILSSIYEHIPSINSNINSEGISSFRMAHPVEEVQISISFSKSAEKELYARYDDYIKFTLTIFGDFDNINYAKIGHKDGRSSAQFRDDIARYNGWSEDLDMTNPFNKQIDDCYNPNILYERAVACYDIIRKRAIMCSDSNDKFDEIINIIKDSPHNKFLIISKRGEYASTVTNYINEKLGIIAGDYHDKIETRIAVNDDGVPILIKSGKNKGQVKKIGSQAISSLNMKAFNENRLRILSVKNSSSDSLEIAVDAIIITSSLCDSIDELRYRFKNVTYNKDHIYVYSLYMEDTIEEKTLINKEKETFLHTIIKKNVKPEIYSENYNDNIF